MNTWIELEILAPSAALFKTWGETCLLAIMRILDHNLVSTLQQCLMSLHTVWHSLWCQMCEQSQSSEKEILTSNWEKEKKSPNGSVIHPFLWSKLKYLQYFALPFLSPQRMDPNGQMNQFLKCLSLRTNNCKLFPTPRTRMLSISA